jgi:hypothetical protein
MPEPRPVLLVLPPRTIVTAVKTADLPPGGQTDVRTTVLIERVTPHIASRSLTSVVSYDKVHVLPKIERKPLMAHKVFQVDPSIHRSGSP